jgi:hypothetical protein
VNIIQPHHVVILVLKRGDGEMSDVQREVHRYLNVVDPQARPGTVPLADLGR